MNHSRCEECGRPREETQPLFEMKMMRMFSIGFDAARKDGQRFVVERTSEHRLRPLRMASVVERPELVVLSGIAVDGREQLLMPMDLYSFSIAPAAEMDREFLEQHGMAGRSDREIQDWLDDSEMGMPSSSIGRLSLPTIPAGGTVTLRGAFGDVPDDFRALVSVVGAVDDQAGHGHGHGHGRGQGRIILP